MMVSSSISNFSILDIFPYLSTHLSADELASGDVLFPHDCLLAALAISFCRYTVKVPGEVRIAALLWSGLLGYLAWIRLDYWIIMSVNVLSYGQGTYQFMSKYAAKPEKKTALTEISKAIQISTVFFSSHAAITHLLFSIAYPEHDNSLFQYELYQFIRHKPYFHGPLVDTLRLKIFNTVSYLLPIEDIQNAYDVLSNFMDTEEFHGKINHLLFVTLYIQVGMGFLGISFLRQEQERKNALVRLEDKLPPHIKQRATGKSPDTKSNNTSKKSKKQKKDVDVSKKFRKSAAPFIFFSAVPYMFQIIVYGGINNYAFHCFRDDFHRIIRNEGLFESDGGRFVATAQEKENYRSPGTYAVHVETIVTTTYEQFNRKFFSLPKLMLLPQIILRQPMLLMKITPLILFSDYLKSIFIATLTSETERLKSEAKELETKRVRLEQYDLKNSELIQRSGYGSMAFTEKKWIEVTEQIQDMRSQATLLQRHRLYFNWIHNHFIMYSLVDCALAKLIAVGKIVSADLFVYARAIEDMIDLVLMRSRAESELASMATAVDTLKDLKNTWDVSEERKFLNCTVASGGSDELLVKGLAYTRGSAAVRIDNLSLGPGIYAVTGANGSGKSTLFRVIMGCDTNLKSIDLESSINIEEFGSVQMPSSIVVEIAQNYYWPLFTKPIDWIYHDDVSSNRNKDKMVSRVVEELMELKFQPEDGDESNSLRMDLEEEKEDWFGDLSGGQKSKVELVRNVFLSGECPKVLLLDETFAALDPESKNLVMQRIKSFCINSIVLVIYHADVKTDESNDLEEDSCIVGSNFFDENLHVEDGSMSVRPVC